MRVESIAQARGYVLSRMPINTAPTDRAKRLPSPHPYPVTQDSVRVDWWLIAHTLILEAGRLSHPVLE